jgi:hypothetical protein
MIYTIIVLYVIISFHFVNDKYLLLAIFIHDRDIINRFSYG